MFVIVDGMEKIIFVDNEDNIIGYGPRSEAIEKGLAHRIARVFVFNSRGELLIQKRSPNVKLAGKWDQSAAGHVVEGEEYATAAVREADEEIGLKDVHLSEIGKFYTEEVDENIMKKRFNTLYIAKYDGQLLQDNVEVSEIKWIEPNELKDWMNKNPTDFTQGFIQAYNFYMNR